MPTGYTANIENDQSFEDFVLGCARTFGACIHQRDEDGNAKPTKRNADNDYYSRALGEARQKLMDLLAMTPTKAASYGTTLKSKKLKSERQGLHKNQELLLKYEAMLEKVTNWAPPTPNHQELKDFMLQQLNDTIRDDNLMEYYTRAIKRINEQAPLDFYTQQLEYAQSNLEYCQNTSDEVKSRDQEANTWIDDLYKSLGK